MAETADNTADKSFFGKISEIAVPTYRSFISERAVSQHEVDALAVRREITVDVLTAEQYDPDFPPAPMPDYLQWVASLQERIPEEFQATATVEFDSVGSYYDSHYGRVEVKYRRPETDEEWERRKANVMQRLAAQRASQEAAERAQFEALKAKYEVPHA